MTPALRNRWVLAGCSAALFAVLAFLTSMAMRADSMERKAQEDRDYQEAIRQALWRMDSALTPILVQEASRPAEQYLPIYSDRRTSAYVKKGGNPESNPQRLLSPLVGLQSDWIRLHFFVELQESGSSLSETMAQACSPQVPTSGRLTDQELLDAASAFPEQIETASKQLADLQAMIEQPGVLAKLGMSIEPIVGEERVQSQTINNLFVYPPAPQQSQKEKTEQEYQARQGNISWAQNALGNALASPVTNLEATWILPPLSKEPELFLLRKTGMQSLRQGIWLDWPHLKKWLCQGTADLFPAGHLRALAEGERASPGLLLASIPAVFEPGAWTAPAANAFPILWWLIAGAWGISIAAFTVLRLTLASATELSERRGRFVSAVTHELRTPLTTFQLYSQMLADGMVPDEKSRKEYLETLKKESERLARIVESVLLYARVEGKRTVQHREFLSASELVGRVRPALEKAAQECGMSLQIDLSNAESTPLHTDPQIVQQVLFNLVDNSCKYAREAGDRRLHLELSTKSGRLEILYFDHGHGIAREDEGKLFQPFQRGAAHVAGNISGTGLGLSLAKALSRDLGGDLSLVKRSGAGACFLLQLPSAPN